MRFGWAWLVCVGLLCFLGGETLAQQSRRGSTPEPATMQATLQQAVQAFTHRQYGPAADLFASLESRFGQEDEYQPIEKTILPIWGYAAQMSGDPQKAIELYERYLRKYPEIKSQRSFVLFSLAQAYQENDDTDAAIATYQRFIEDNPTSSEAVLSALRQADLYFEAGRRDEGVQRLVGFSQAEQVPVMLRAQARLRAVQKLLEEDALAEAAPILLDYEWSISQMPELAVLTFAALELADYLLSQRQYEDAIRALRLVPSRDVLLETQRERQTGMRAALEQAERQRGFGRGGEVWRDFYRRLLARVDAQMEALAEAEDYTPGYQLRLGRAFLLAERPFEARTLFRELAQTENLPKDVRGQAHYSWILAVNALERWEEAREVAERFVDRYPESPLVPQALFLLAFAFQQERLYGDAVAMLTRLIEEYPAHPEIPRWRYFRGLNNTYQKENAPAREDFAAIQEAFPEHALRPNADLWHGMAWFFDREYPEALAELNAALERTPKKHPLFPEMKYRRANTLYAAKEYDRALVAINAFLENYGNHQRAPEAKVLRGDILMGQGRLIEASAQFAEITPEAGPLFPYAVFQRGKILKANESYEKMIEHFRGYLDRGDVPEKVRIAEALYWIGWAHQQLDRTAEAFPIFANALARYGNDPKAGETGGILQALHELHRRYHRGEVYVEWDDFEDRGLLATENFEDWLMAERERALRNDELTWYSRINLYLASLDRKRNDPNRAELRLLEILENTPVDDLDAEGLAEVGLMMSANNFPSAKQYFDRLLEEFPGRFQTGAAYYGLAQLAAFREDWEEAARHLADFQAEAPLHPKKIDATLLQGRVLIADGRPALAVPRMEELLRLKAARGRPHAQALLILGEAHEAMDEPKKAFAYYQRVYTLYRAYPELLVEAYRESARLAEQIGQLRTAYKTYRELLADERIEEQFPEAVLQALEARDRLKPLLPPETETAATNPPNEEPAL